MTINLKIKVLSIVLIIIITYSILSVLRSAGLLYLMYSDDYFYNFNLDLDQYSEKVYIYIRFYYYVPYLIGLVGFILARRFFITPILYYILASLSGIIMFWLIDARYIRSLFALFGNTRTNNIIILLTFILLGVGVLIFNNYWEKDHE